MKHQVLFSSKNKRNKIKCRLLHFLFGALHVKETYNTRFCHANVAVK